MQTEKIGSILSIKDQEFLDFSDESIKNTWDDMLYHAKTKSFRDILEIRTIIQSRIQASLVKRGFLHPPLYTLSSCVDPLNHETERANVNYYGQECSLMQSLIFHKMAILSVCDLEKIFWLSPNVRKELNVRDKKRYASEFTQVDFESSCLRMQSCITLIEEITSDVINYLARNKAELIEQISGRRLKEIKTPLARFDAEEEALIRMVEAEDIEAILSLEMDEPFILTNLKREAYDKRDEKTGKYLNFDICLPKTGEILSGAEREFDYERLKFRMEELGYPLAYFEPILKLAREEGLKATTGAGFGIERFLRGILLLDDIADIYPFKRRPEESIIF